MASRIDVEITIGDTTVDGKQVSFAPGDTIELGEGGLIVWFDGPLAEAVRLIQKKHQEEIRRVIEFTRSNQGK